MDMLSKDAGDAPSELVKKLRDTLASHCEKDQWSAATRTCLANIKTKDDAPKCEDTLSSAQRSSLDKENIGGEGGGAPGNAGASAPAPTSTMSPPSPSPPPLGGSRSPTTKTPPKKGGDPEDGGD